MILPRLTTLAASIFFAGYSPVAQADPIAFWNTTQRGANSFNLNPPDAAYFEALSDTGATWTRLVFSKWDSASPDFLIGDAAAYNGLVPADLEVLRGVLDDAHAVEIGVVLTPLTLPGSRWIQQNDGQFDDRLWSDPAYAGQVAAFWRDLAAEIGDHPAVVGYNILNEPVPEKTTGLAENSPMDDYLAWQRAHKGTPRDLPALYENVIASIRTVDPQTPVMVDAGFYGNPRALATWDGPLTDDRVLYAVHMYEPYAATSPGNLRNETPVRYPGAITTYAGEQLAWDGDTVAAHLAYGFDWAAAHDIPSNRVVLGEFGCMRLWADCGTYLADVLDAAEDASVHWAFYAFREDEWDGMDYELPASLETGRFYWLSSEGRADEIPRDGPLMTLLKDRMLTE